MYLSVKKTEYISLKNIGLFGKCITSNNKKYKLCWGLDTRQIALLENEEFIFTIDNLFYVTNADIAENGTVIVSGSYNKESKSDTLLICNNLGEKIFSKKISSKIYNLAISESGNLCVVQNCNSITSESDSGKLFTIDIINQKIISKFTSALGWADNYKFYEEEKKIQFIYSDNTIEYSLQGECLEPNKIPIPKKSNYEIFYSLEREFQKISDKTSINKIKELYNEYYGISNSDFTPNVASLTFRHLGELALMLDDKNNALTFLEKAISINPKIGIKKKILELKKDV